mmetsp:Transcript_4386/g.18666  ORF Transcript_4386/g.18666 Transcript_4386/m.18666 type:complete len:112 (-) Transcript_4386:1900-2235(-)
MLIVFQSQPSFATSRRLQEVIHRESKEGTMARPTLMLVFEFLDHDLKQYMVAKQGKGKGLPLDVAKVKIGRTHLPWEQLIRIMACYSSFAEFLLSNSARFEALSCAQRDAS